MLIMEAYNDLLFPTTSLRVCFIRVPTCKNPHNDLFTFSGFVEGNVDECRATYAACSALISKS
jgi:hypothetical protein